MAVTQRAWRALGTGVVVLTTQAEGAGPAARAVARVLAEVDATYSRFREDSELSRVNRQSGKPVRVGPLLYRAVTEALRASRLTGGAVDPTVGATLRLIGYDKDFSLIDQGGGPLGLAARPIPGWQLVQLSPASQGISVPRGVELDLGSTGKALAADLAAAEAMAAAGSGGVLVSLGGDIAVAGEPPEGGWRVLAAEDSAVPPTNQGQTVTIIAGGLATSSITVRRWRRGEQLYHHIVDPATGLPVASPWRTATVYAASCLDANIAATAAIVLGTGALPWLEANGLDARLVAIDGSVIRSGRWPADRPAEPVTVSQAGAADDDAMEEPGDLRR
ncbi:MAG TPA: FAD:protein FMN transferase [Candidatus Dormibacteraeota bacterium]